MAKYDTPSDAKRSKVGYTRNRLEGRKLCLILRSSIQLLESCERFLVMSDVAPRENFRYHWFSLLRSMGARPSVQELTPVSSQHHT